MRRSLVDEHRDADCCCDRVRAQAVRYSNDDAYGLLRNATPSVLVKGVVPDDPPDAKQLPSDVIEAHKHFKLEKVADVTGDGEVSADATPAKA